MRKQNRGEWSEYTTKMSILGSKAIRVIDHELKTDSVCVVRSLSVSNKKYKLLGKSIYETTTLDDGKTSSRFVAFNDDIQHALSVIHKRVKQGRGSFEVLEAEALANRLGIETSADYYHNKGDVYLEYLKNCGNVSAPEAFSIKSFVGNNPTIMNASINSTRIRLRITDLDNDTLNMLKQKNLRVRDNVQKILSLGGGFRWVSFSDTLDANLAALDAKKQLVFAVLAHFNKKEKGASKMAYLETLSKDEKKGSFEAAMKRVLRAALTGMMPSEYWTGVGSISEKMLLAMPDGSCVAFLAKSALENYLYNHCYIDTPSQNKHKYGFIYEEQGQWFIDLNFQIRLARSII